MKAILRYPFKQQNQALQCLAVAEVCGVEVDHGQDETWERIMFSDDGVVLRDSTAIIFHLVNSSMNLVKSARTLQWMSFVASEIRLILLFFVYLSIFLFVAPIPQTASKYRGPLSVWRNIFHCPRLCLVKMFLEQLMLLLDIL